MGLESTQDKYEFFENVDHVRIYNALNSANTTGHEVLSDNQSLIKCNNQGINGNAKEVCEKLNKAFKLLCSSESEFTSNKQLNSSDYKYLNFWANFELNGEHFVDNSSIESFRNLMNNEDYERFSKEKMKAVLEHIEEEDLKRMKILDNLYQRYYEMQEIIFSTSEERFEKCLRYSSECFNEYRNAFSTDEIGKYFNSALTNFKKAYEELVSKAFSKDTSYVSYIAKIPEDPNESELSFYTIGDRRNKIILISLFGSVIAVVLVLIYFYKFTHFGTLIRARSRKKKKKFHNQDDNMKNSQCTNDPNIISYNNRKYNLAYHSARNS
ncbi:PIR protein [Plasmodium vivax]|uniref:VIR protein n=1 Tax=Plasmodium vivax TaxID=5855 RepID=A0A565A5H4_PLAVI|nr:PIR protein [Plasmodium vivax]